MMTDPQYDPYQAWLGISRQVAEADHYQLLGLPRFEEAHDKIKAAFEQRVSVVRKYQVGTYADHAQQMLVNLSAAYHCLTSSTGKTEYDQQLRRWAAEATIGSGAGTTVVEPLAEPAPPVEPPPHPAPAATPPSASKVGPVTPAGPEGETQISPVIVTVSIATCAGCGSPILPLENCLIVPVEIDAEGNVHSPRARAVKRTSLARIVVDIDAAELGYAPAQCGPFLTRACWMAMLGTMAAGAVTASVLLHALSGEDPWLPTAVLAVTVSACLTAAWRFCVPPIRTGEEAAWDRLAPLVSAYDRPARDFGFIAGLADASFRHAVRRLGDDVGAVERWRTGRLRRETAWKRTAVLERCLERGKSLLKTGQIGPEAVGQLYRLAVTDALTTGASPARLRPLLADLFDHCLGDELPLACLDTALLGTGLFDRLSPVELWRVRWQLYRACAARAFSAQDILALPRRSRALQSLFSVPPKPTLEAIACALALLRNCRRGLAAVGGNGIWELDQASDEAAWAAAPDLLAVSNDREVALRMSGFCVEGFLLKSESMIWKRYAFASAPKNARISAWVSLYFHELLPAKDREQARPAAVEHLSRAEGMSVICPGCQRWVSLTEDDIRLPARSA